MRLQNLLPRSRVIVARDGRQKLQSRSPRANVAETQAFMDGAKRILVFSDAGGTGRSYHADLAAKNQARRVHFLLEPGWRADAAIQGLGRTNRTNQASAPLFRPVTTDVRGERRFISTIARRLDSLGALTRGQRQTGGQNLFDPADNLESIYAKEALHRWFGLLFTGKLEAVSLGRFQELTRTTQGGTSIPSISVVTDRPARKDGKTYKDENGYTAKDSEFHRITCFNGLGQNVAKYCTKGQLVTVEGRIHYTQWEDQSGTKRYGCEIIADKVDFLTKGRSGSNEGAPDIDED